VTLLYSTGGFDTHRIDMSLSISQLLVFLKALISSAIGGNVFKIIIMIKKRRRKV
jgi:hypothetical protein